MKESNYKYEVIVVLNPKAESKEKEKSIGVIEAKIAEMKFEVENREDMGTKSLAYKIKGLDKGDFWCFHVGGKNPIKLNEFNLFLNRESNIIRYLILKK